jgi:hypothetical protein
MICTLALLALQDSFVELIEAEALFGTVSADQVQFGRRLGFSDGSLFVVTNEPHPDGVPNSLGGASAGALYVLDHDGGAFDPTQVLLHPEPRHGFLFASVLKSQGDRFLLTDALATDDGEAVYRGRSYIYEKVAGSWSVVQTILSTYTGTGSLFSGGAGDLDGDRLVLTEAGHPGLGAPNTGLVRIFDHDGHEFVETAQLMTPSVLAGNPMGIPTRLDGLVSLDGDTLMMGVLGNRVLVWERSPSGTWGYKQVLEPPSFALGARFPRGLTVVGEWAVGGHRAEPTGSLRGRAVVFRRNSVTTLWEYHQTLEASDGLSSPPPGPDDFGFSAHMTAERIIVGAPATRNALGIVVGQAYTFALGEDGFWHPEAVLRTERSKSMTSGSGPFVGGNVHLDDGIAAVYSLGDYQSDPAIREGSVTVFELPIGQRSCDGRPNSVAPTGAQMEVLGRSFASYGAWTIEGEDLPRFAAVLPLMGSQSGSTVLSQGELCLGGAVFRLGSAFGFSDQLGRFSQSFESSDGLVEPDVLAGSTWHFQLWYRDFNPAAVSNFSSAVELMFR